MGAPYIYDISRLRVNTSLQIQDKYVISEHHIRHLSEVP